ncbi:MAG: XRE family transcriptional regulator [Bacteroidales bacterium]|nr:XRE family transcriptional regulator [Bacteroidales bacterium]
MVEQLHIGKLIKAKLDEQGRKASWLAKRVNCTRFNIYKVFQREWIDTKLLLEISEALGYNFFECYAQMFEKGRTNTEK